MSRAFAKEPEDQVADFADRPISPFRNFVTAEGLRAIESALGRFEAAHRAAVDKGDKAAAAAALREVRCSSYRQSNLTPRNYGCLSGTNLKTAVKGDGLHPVSSR